MKTLNTPPSIETMDRIQMLLANYLLACPRFQCPGMDGASLADVVGCEYPAASAAGWVPRPDELASRHPEIAHELADFFQCETSTVMSS